MKTQSNYIFFSNQLQKLDNYRFISCLFAPESIRYNLVILYNFNLEIARIIEQTKDEMLGLIRLQWWKDQVENIFNQQPKQLPLAIELAKIIDNCQLPKEELLLLISSREFALATETPKHFSLIEDYARNSSGTLNKLALRIISTTSPDILDQAEQLGIVWGLIGILRNLKLKRNFIPTELLSYYDLTTENYQDPLHKTKWLELGRFLTLQIENRLYKLNNVLENPQYFPLYCFKTIAKRFLNKFAQIKYNFWEENTECNKLFILLSLLWHRYNC